MRSGAITVAVGCEILLTPWSSDDDVGTEARLMGARVVVDVRFADEVLAIAIGEGVDDGGVGKRNEGGKGVFESHLD